MKPRTQLARMSAAGFAGAGSEWMTVVALGHARVGGRRCRRNERTRRSCARDWPSYEGQMAVIGTGVYVVGAVDRLRAGLAELDGAPDEADRLFAAALTQDQAMRSRPLETRTRHWWGRALLRRGDVARARPLLDRARADAADLGMAGVAAQIDALG